MALHTMCKVNPIGWVDDDDEVQSEIEAQHASTRIQQRESRGTFRMVIPRQRKQVRINNPQSSDNQRSTAQTQ
jgi:hypothetical protein